MIPLNDILAWRTTAPWGNLTLVEQDLVLSRALISLYSSSTLKSKLAFRGGTALNKIYFKSPARFSEDIDLVQISAEPIGETIDEIRSCMDHWLGEPRRVLKEGRAVLNYRYDTEENNISAKLKLEINTREHVPIFGYEQHSVNIDNHWFSGTSQVTTYCLEELLGTKIRALYQRKKGRDLFDLWYANKSCNPNWIKAIKAFNYYITEQKLKVSSQEFQQNLELKLTDQRFLLDIESIKEPGLEYNLMEAKDLVERLIGLLSKEEGAN